MSDEQLRERFQALAERDFDARVLEGFALVREASRRVLDMRPFDVQLLGGLTLLGGKLAEMRTGEGKTLTIVAPAALLALDRRGVHVVTANSYLAARDAQLMQPLYAALGLSVGAIDSTQSNEQKRQAYACDVTYGVGYEFGFDYLRDNLVSELPQRVQRGLAAAIVDEVDSILIDEARTPLIISGSADSQESAIRAIDKAVASLLPGDDYVVVQKERTATLTEQGYDKLEQLLAAAGVVPSGTSLYDATNLHLVRRVHCAVTAYGLYRRDRDYVVEASEVLLVDPGTGRKMPGRRLEEGLHEAIEAREGVTIHAGTVTRATITYQNFFGLYERLAGLTGTALTEAEEFNEFYHLETVVIPTNRPIARIQRDDLVFRTKAEKFTAAAAEIRQRQLKGQPVLAGCASVRDAEVLSELLKREGVAHEVLTAKHLEREAHIIAAAGRLGAVTVATNMAGRGTDIALGGEKPARDQFEDEDAFARALSDWEAARAAVRQAGGLYVLGTERSGIRRVDNQLAGRSGRQGDPGEVQFYLSLEDELLRHFNKSRQIQLVYKLIDQAGGALGGQVVSRLVTASQRKFEGQGFDARRQLMKFDSVLAGQRSAVYALRDQLLQGGGPQYLQAVIAGAAEAWAQTHLDPALQPEQWDAAALKRQLLADLGVDVPLVGWIHKEELERDAVVTRLQDAVKAQYAGCKIPEEQRTPLVLEILTELWTEHLSALEELRKSVSLKGNTGFNPVFQFHKDAFALFVTFEAQLASEVARNLLAEALRREREERARQVSLERAAFARVAAELEKRPVGRNEPCPCGSGVRFKLCHGKLA
ncbi:preprotein translocase subunit SecA [compost metagenome]